MTVYRQDYTVNRNTVILRYLCLPLLHRRCTLLCNLNTGHCIYLMY